jgi:hypothetical protein
VPRPPANGYGSGILRLCCMNSIILFRKDERKIIDTMKERLGDGAAEIESLETNLKALEELADSISKYPSILESQRLGSSQRSLETLVDTLCGDDINDLLLHMPTKAILGKGFAVAKVNFFFLLLYISREKKPLQDLAGRLGEIITRNIYAILAEEVYLSIISDRDTPLHVRTNAAYNLVNLWEHRIDCGVREFAPILGSLWSARKKLKPAFGTLLGFSELFMLTEESDDSLVGFFNQDTIHEDVLYSLQEFLMGLSYEEMGLLFSRMVADRKSSLSVEEIDKILGAERVHPRYDYSDPREIFRSYMLRKKNSQFRALSAIPGPKKTFEENLMSFLLSRPALWNI